MIVKYFGDFDDFLLPANISKISVNILRPTSPFCRQAGLSISFYFLHRKYFLIIHSSSASEHLREKKNGKNETMSRLVARLDQHHHAVVWNVDVFEDNGLMVKSLFNVYDF